jgi:serine/threonine protein kinase
MYEILTDREVFPSNLSEAELERGIRSAHRPTISNSVRPEFGEIIEKCWDANPSKRPSLDAIWAAVWFMGYRILDRVDGQILGAQFDSWAPPPITVETLDKLPKGHYIDLGELGSGRHGTVSHLRVRLGRDFRDFAAKFYQQEESQDEDLESFTELIRLFGALRHPCLATIAFAEPPTTEMGPVVWTDYFSEGSLDRYLKAVRSGANLPRFSPTQLVLVICGIVLGLNALHRSNLFHGNLKPSDVLIDADFNVHLTDYISYSLEHCYLTYSCLVSSPNYTAPEGFDLEDAEFAIEKRKCWQALQRVDVFSLGLIIYEMLTGAEVFSAELGVPDLRRKTQSSERPPIPDSIKADFRKLIDRCWDPDSSKRPSIGEVWHILVQMKFNIIDGVDSDYLASRVSQWSPP